MEVHINMKSECVWDKNGKNNKIINKNSMIFRQNFYCCYRSKSNFISTDHDLLSDQRNFKEKENEKFYAESFLLNVCTAEERRERERERKKRKIFASHLLL